MLNLLVQEQHSFSAFTFPLLVSECGTFWNSARKYCVIRVGWAMPAFYIQTITKKYVLMKIDFTFTCPVNKQLQKKVVRRTSWSFFDPKKKKKNWNRCFFSNILTSVKLFQSMKLFDQFFCCYFINLDRKQKMMKLTPSITICFKTSDFYKIREIVLDGH